MNILSVDTATEACSAAWLVDGEVLERFRIAPRQHTRLILPMIASLLDEAGMRLQDLDALALGRGPGSFTGLRIAAGIVQGLALGANLPVVTVSS
ncbi:MAG: tRNA (adenosine(37)-N6)-threonylcarbamoyltransferase complex dimerization subunit type 1 TsaB, partial [Methylococcales bacterium]|nr:tRNA (adenosine(37)-N6)-threonylcarbamoyltransferase complex dimerization subunit type 1 TsaB [Methylococcales bacterium]